MYHGNWQRFAQPDLGAAPCGKDENVRRQSLRVAFIMSTNFAGSTLLGLMLGTAPFASFLGEPALLMRRKRTGEYRHAKFCSSCRDEGGGLCPVWSRSTIQRVRDEPWRVYDIVHELDRAKTFFIDGSKNLDWLEASAPRVAEPFVLHLSKSVESFAASVVKRTGNSRKLEFIGSDWALANRQIRESCVRIGLPYLHLKYDDFASTTDAVMRRVGTFLGIESGRLNNDFWRSQPHFVKGNPGVAEDLHKSGGRPVRLDDAWRTTFSMPQLDRMYALRDVQHESDVLGYRHPLRSGETPVSVRAYGRIIAPALAAARRLVHRAKRVVK